MEIKLAQCLGMCFGVKRALNMAFEASEQASREVVTLGPLVHNHQVTKRLSEKGISVKDMDNIPENATVIVRSHGVGPSAYQRLEKKGCYIFDGTCPFVKKALDMALAAQKEGWNIVILGDPDHAEVKGYLEWLNDKTSVINMKNVFTIDQLTDKVGLMAQTTQSVDDFNRLHQLLLESGRKVLPLNTICSATRQRKDAALDLAEKADVVIVIGGRHSANTNKLADYCRQKQPMTYLIEHPEEIDREWFRGAKTIGITAGASTPEWIIKEVVEKMEEFKDQVVEQNAQNTEAEQEMDFSEMEAQMGCRAFHTGDVVKGTVVKVSSDEVLVDIGYKSEGIIPAFELAFTKVDPHSVVAVGDEITAEVVKEDRDGNIVLSRKNALFEEKIDRLEEAFEKGETVQATVIDVVKGGLLVDVGIRGFVPASHVERGFVKDLSAYLKQELQLKIIELNRGARKVILSRKALLDETYQKQKEEFWGKIEEGQTIRGTVKRLTDFGAFVDIGGADGLLHVSEMGWGKVAKPSDVVSIDDEIEVYVLKLDREKEKISLSLKQLAPNPWSLADSKYQVGEIYNGIVMRTTTFGAFVQLEPGLEGLVHISQVANFRVNKVEDVLKAGQEIPVKVLEVDMDKKRISLSIKEAFDLPKPEIEEPVSEVVEEEVVLETPIEAPEAVVQEAIEIKAVSPEEE